MHGGCGQVRANQLKRTFPCFFSAQALVEKLLRGGGAKAWYFTALEATPIPPEIHCSSRIPFLRIFKDQGLSLTSVSQNFLALHHQIFQA